ncbi:MAG TPA: peptidyl-prolyl cis-trans isomerase [Candidatus Xenobia bacterium]
MRSKVLIGALAVFLVGCSRLDRAIQPDPLQQVLAVVDTEPVTQAELIVDLEEHEGKLALSGLMLAKRVAHLAHEHQIKLDEARFNAESSKLRARIQDPYRLDYELRQLKSALLVRSLVLENVSEATKRQFYDKFKEDLREYDVSQLLVKSAEEARLAALRINHTGDFATEARLISEDEPSRMDGGALGLLDRASLEKIFGPDAAAQITRLPVGVVSPPLHSLYGYHLVEVTRSLQSYDDLKQAVEDQIVYGLKGRFMEKLGLELKGQEPPYIIPPGRPPIDVGAFVAPSGSPTTAIFVPPSGSPSSAVFVPPSGAPSSQVFAPPPSGHPSSGVFSAPSGSPCTSVFDIPSGSPR